MVDYQFKTEPRNHQLECWKISKDKEYFYIRMDAGTGKTKVVIDTAAYLWERREIDTLLVIAPNRVHKNWLTELMIHMPDRIPWRASYYEAGMNKANLEAMNCTLNYTGGLRIITVNVEALSYQKGLEFCKSVLKKHVALTVFDESHKIKTPSSRRTRGAYALSNLSAYRRNLSGTPTGKGIQDLYSQWRFLNWQVIGCKTFTEYRSRYCILGGWENRQIVGFQNVDELRAKIAPFTYEKSKWEMDLPPLIKMPPTEVELSEEQSFYYKQLRDEFIAEFRDAETLTAAQGGVRAQRFLQVLSGFLPYPEDAHLKPSQQRLHEFENPRIDALIEQLETCGEGKSIVWCRYRYDIRRLSERLKKEGINYTTYYGADSTSSRDENMEKFKTDPGCEVLLATRATGGTGFTINEASNTHNYTHIHDYIDYEQALSRNHRIGQTNSVTMFTYVAKVAIEKKILKVLENREDIAKLFSDLKAFREMLLNDTF